MIRYALVCDKAHAFESWFRSSADFDAQRKQSLVTCPVCNSADVGKQIMAPSLARSDRQASLPAPASESSQEVALIGEREQALRAAIRSLREQVLAHSEDVGKAFPEEARKIHYGESEPRFIRGEASPEAVRSLNEEGVSCVPLPSLPDERN